MTDRQKAIEAAFKAWYFEGQEPDPQYENPNYTSASAQAFQAGADWQEAQTGWVPIADIPDEWKDGRVLIMHGEDPREGPYDYFCMFRSDKNGFWQTNGRTAGEAFLTHAMLPPSPPAKDKP